MQNLSTGFNVTCCCMQGTRTSQIPWLDSQCNEYDGLRWRNRSREYRYTCAIKNKKKIWQETEGSAHKDE